jgi:hypothetical protein
MVVIAFFALDQLLREMPHSKLTVAARFSLYLKKYKDDREYRKYFRL